MDKLIPSILKTLSYADVFDFPLKANEIWRYLIINAKRKTQNAKLQLKTQRLVKIGKIEKKAGFYFLKGREKIVKLRQGREKESRKKLQIAKRVAEFLKFIPTVQMVAVTGALAIRNSKEQDDIDLLIVSQTRRIWTTRFLTTVFVEIFAKRRRPGDQEFKDKICLNMFLDEDCLAIPQKERDLYSAHEVIQLKPLWEKDNTYQKFLAANGWVEKFLPNAEIKTKNQKPKTKNTYQILTKKKKALNSSIPQFLNYCENVLKHFQLWYMRKRRTNEKISDGIIRFHPKDARSWVLKEYQKKIRRR